MHILHLPCVLSLFIVTLLLLLQLLFQACGLRSKAFGSCGEAESKKEAFILFNQVKVCLNASLCAKIVCVYRKLHECLSNHIKSFLCLCTKMIENVETL